MSLSFDGFWQSAIAYEPPTCTRCDERVAADEHGYCSCCHWQVQAEVEDGWPAFWVYLGNWAAFRDWEMPE